MSENKSVVIVMHAHRVWKDTFFVADTEEAAIALALGAVRMCQPKTPFKKENGSKLVAVDSGAIYLAKPLKQYEGLSKLIEDRIY